MTIAQRMLDYAKQYQEVNVKQYQRAFEEIENVLEDSEQVVFAATADSYVRNEQPAMWYAAYALTKRRLIIGGERTKGMIMVSYATESIPLCDIQSVESANSFMNAWIVINTFHDELKLELKSPEMARKIVKTMNSMI